MTRNPIARLMAAAPDLLAALEGLDAALRKVRLPHECLNPVLAMRAAIAKARGDGL